MNRENIIRMAREAGFTTTDRWDRDFMPLAGRVERFAALVAAHIRETEFKPDWNNYNQGRKDGAEEEREACAKVCDDLDWSQDSTWQVATLDCAAAIRARGQA